MINSSAVQYLEIQGPDFAGRKFAVISGQQYSTGSGILKGSIMPLPKFILDLFGTQAFFYLNGVSSYDTVSGLVTGTAPRIISCKVYPEAYTLEECSKLQEVLQGDIKIYVSGAEFSYDETALLVLQVRETGGPSGRIK